MTTPEERVRGIQNVWSAGSYANVGDLWAGIGRDLADELDARVGLAGRDVCDAACGTGNTTLALAHAGARVVGLDLTPDLLAVASERAEAAGLEITWRVGDLVDLPLEDDEFDVVTSTFGAFTADDPHRCASELARVCRPGGTIATTAWGRSGPFELLREVVFEAHPQLAEMPRPDTAAWAEPEGLEERFAGTPARLVDLDERVVPLPFASLEGAVAFLTQWSGPVLMVRKAVEGLGGSWEAISDGLIEAWRPHAREVDGGIELLAPYGRALLTVD